MGWRSVRPMAGAVMIRPPPSGEAATPFQCEEANRTLRREVEAATLAGADTVTIPRWVAEVALYRRLKGERPGAGYGD